MKCLESRMMPNGIRRRRYKLEDGNRETTYEIPEGVIRSLGWDKIERYVAERARGAERMKRALQLREAVRKNIDCKSTALAHELGVSEQHIRLIRKRLRQEMGAA